VEGDLQALRFAVRFPEFMALPQIPLFCSGQQVLAKNFESVTDFLPAGYRTAYGRDLLAAYIWTHPLTYSSFARITSFQRHKASLFEAREHS
jgi:hypothetical protein